MNSSLYKIDTLSTQGEGIARKEGKAVFIPYTLPGETWEARIIEEHKKYDRALPICQISISQPQFIERIEPRCPYFGQCGGCQLQHIDYIDQVSLKQNWLKETFRRIGHLDVNVEPIMTSEPWEYRNKVTIPLIERDGKTVLAFHRAYFPADYIQIEDCVISQPPLRKLIEKLSSVLQKMQLKLIPYSKRGLGSRVMLRVIDDRKVVQFFDTEINSTNANILQELIDEKYADEVISSSGQSWQQDEKPLSDSEVFLQVNDPVREELYNHVLNLPFQSYQRLLDGYCGVGILTQRVAEKFEEAVGVESNPHAAAYAESRLKKVDSGKQIQIISQTVERYLQTVQIPFDTVILNPPRSGLSKEARTRIAKMKPRDLVIISCHPAALARDTSVFVDHGYTINDIQPFDMFPQTYHLETTVHLRG